MLMHRHGNLSSCQISARAITEEINTISNIDCVNQSAEVSVAVIESKRQIINAHLDEMIRVIKQKSEKENDNGTYA